MGEGQAYPEIIICIPGTWKTCSELVERVARDSDGYPFIGMLPMELATRHTFELQSEDVDQIRLTRRLAGNIFPA